MSASSGGRGGGAIKRQISKIDTEHVPKKGRQNVVSTAKPTTTPTQSNKSTVKHNGASTQSGPNGITNNQYGILPDDDSGDDTDMIEDDVPRVRQQRAPPIVVVNSSPTALQNLLNQVIVSKKFQLKLMRIGIRIDMAEFNDYEAVTTELKAKNLHFYAYHTSATRPTKVVLYGLYNLCDDEIKQCLANVGVVPDQIKKLHINKPAYDKQVIFLLYFKPGTARIADLRKIKHIDNLVVRWERFQPKKYDKVAQCRKCQNFGHSSINCHLPARCTLCAENHDTKECVKKKSRAEIQTMKDTQTPIDRSFVKCVLCNENHTANYIGCRVRQEYMTLQQKQARSRPSRKTKRLPPPPLDHYNFPHIPGIQVDRQPTAKHQRLWSEMVDSQQQHLQQQHLPQNEMMHTMIRTLQTMMDGMRDMMNKMTEMMTIVIQRLAVSP